MADGSEISFDLLVAARCKGHKLLADMLEQRAQIDANPTHISADNLKAGREAFENTIASTGRMLEALDQAIRLVDATDRSN